MAGTFSLSEPTIDPPLTGTKPPSEPVCYRRYGIGPGPPMGSPVSKAGDTQADATQTTLQCQGWCEQFGGARLNQWQQKSASSSRWQYPAGAGACIWQQRCTRLD